jgi:hypothetical protein
MQGRSRLVIDLKGDIDDGDYMVWANGKLRIWRYRAATTATAIVDIGPVESGRYLQSRGSRHCGRDLNLWAGFQQEGGRFKSFPLLSADQPFSSFA